MKKLFAVVIFLSFPFVILLAQKSKDEIEVLKVNSDYDLAILKNKPFSERGRYTYTWMYKDGCWQMVTDHVSVIPVKQAASTSKTDN